MRTAVSAAEAIFAWRRWKEAKTEIVQREELQKLQKKLEHQASHDALTDLPNRALLMERLKHAIERRIRGQGMIAVLFIDLDGFSRTSTTPSGTGTAIGCSRKPPGG
jgi:PleD family two-component response regulator